MPDEKEAGQLEVEQPKTPAVKKNGKKSAFAEGDDVLFKLDRIHGFHGTVIDPDFNGWILCCVNDDAAKGELVVVDPGDITPLKDESLLEQSNHDRLA
jgi:hypothetical protein